MARNNALIALLPKGLPFIFRLWREEEEEECCIATIKGGGRGEYKRQ